MRIHKLFLILINIITFTYAEESFVATIPYYGSDLCNNTIHLPPKKLHDYGFFFGSYIHLIRIIVNKKLNNIRPVIKTNISIYPYSFRINSHIFRKKYETTIFTKKKEYINKNYYAYTMFFTRGFVWNGKNDWTFFFGCDGDMGDIMKNMIAIEFMGYTPNYELYSLEGTKNNKKTVLGEISIDYRKCTHKVDKKQLYDKSRCLILKDCIKTYCDIYCYKLKCSSSKKCLGKLCDTNLWLLGYISLIFMGCCPLISCTISMECETQKTLIWGTSICAICSTIFFFVILVVTL